MTHLLTQNLPIGVFDSGMGGLTVLRALKNALPNESFVYLGDTARLPYGTKSRETIIRYAIQMAELLVERDVKTIVIACNTATSAALHELKKHLPDLPIIGVVEPGAQAAVQAASNNRILVLATETTIRSEIYQHTILRLNRHIKVITQACGLFVALAEEGCVDDEVSAAAVRKYLTPLLAQLEKQDCVLLGCTHFPVLIKPLRYILGDEINIVDSAATTAKMVELELQRLNLLNRSAPAVDIQFLVTDLPERFARVGEIFFGQAIPFNSVSLIDGKFADKVIPKVSLAPSLMNPPTPSEI